MYFIIYHIITLFCTIILFTTLLHFFSQRGNQRGGRGGYEDGGGQNNEVQLPDAPPFTAYVGNLASRCVQGDIDHLFNEVGVSICSSFSLLSMVI